MKLLSFENRYSIVGYPVGYHFDKFADDKQSFENKMTFDMDLKLENLNIGRGGCGEMKFVFLLLDWTNSVMNSTIQNQYIAAGGNLPKGAKLTQSMWTEQFGI